MDLTLALALTLTLTLTLTRTLTHTTLSEVLLNHSPWQPAGPPCTQRTLRMPIGADWNTAITHNKAIQPKVVVKAGKMVDPIGNVCVRARARARERVCRRRRQSDDLAPSFCLAPATISDKPTSKTGRKNMEQKIASRPQAPVRRAGAKAAA